MDWERNFRLSLSGPQSEKCYLYKSLGKAKFKSKWNSPYIRRYIIIQTY